MSLDNRLNAIQDAQRGLEDMLQAVRSFSHNGGGNGTSGGMSDDWKATVESQLFQLHGDVRLLIGAGIAALLVALGAIAGSHMALSNQVSSAQVDIGKVSAREDALDKRLDSIDGKLDKLLDEKRAH